MVAADTQIVARLLREYAQRTALRGGNRYRVKAYSRAADSSPRSRCTIEPGDFFTIVPASADATFFRTSSTTGTRISALRSSAMSARR